MIWTTKRREWTVTWTRHAAGLTVNLVLVAQSMAEARAVVDDLLMDKHVVGGTIRIGQTGSVIIDRSK